MSEIPSSGKPRLQRLWRISDYVDLSGEGGSRYNSRWHTIGSRIVFLAESAAGAMIEVLTHVELEGEDIPFYTLMEVAIPEDIGIQLIEVPESRVWKHSISLTRNLGDTWLRSLATPLARVPSAVMPHTWNYLLNPEHPDATRIEIASVTREQFDGRLFRFGSR